MKTVKNITERFLPGQVSHVIGGRKSDVALSIAHLRSAEEIVRIGYPFRDEKSDFLVAQIVTQHKEQTIPALGDK